jgi:beta-lactamase regulating signal transducer with metallopeptidase domain
MMLDSLTTSVIVQSIGVALLHFIWQGTLVGLLTAIILKALAQHTATSRYLVGCGALLLMLALPVWTAVERAGRPVQSAPVARPSAITAGGAAPLDEPSDIAPGPRTRETRHPAGVRFLSPMTQPPDQWVPAMVMVWFAGVTLLSLRLALSWYWAAHLCARDTWTVADDWRRQVAAVSSRLNISRPIRVLESARTRVPAVVGWARPVLLLPVAALAGLSPTQVEAVIAHELAHIRRHDYLVNALQSIIETVLFYHPAVWWISAHVRQEREHCCDDIAVSVCGDPIAYGRALADLDEGRSGDGAAVLAANGGSLATRVRRLVGAPTRQHPASIVGVVAVATGALSLVVVAYATEPMAPTEQLAVARGHAQTPRPAAPILPSLPKTTKSGDVPVPPEPPAPPVPAPRANTPDSPETKAPSPPRPPAPAVPPPAQVAPAPPIPPRSPRENAIHVVSLVDGISNAVGLSADWEKGLAGLGDLQLAPGDQLMLSRGSERVELSAAQDGAVQRLYYVDGKRQRFGLVSGTILGDVLSTLIRSFGVGVERRVARILGQTGVDGVLQEITRLTATSAPPFEDAFAYRYFATLFDLADLTDAEAVRVLTQAGLQVRSEYDRALILMQQQRRAKAGPLVRDAFFTATGTIESDHEMRLVLTELVSGGPVSSGLLRATLETAGGLQTDEERARLLTDIAETQSLAPRDTDQAARDLFFERLDGMQSNSERAGVLTAVAAHANDSATRAAVLASTARLNSDAHKRRVLRAVTATRLEAPIRAPFFLAAGSIHSDHEKRRALSGIADLEEPAAEALRDALRMATDIQTDHELASLLVRIAERHALDSQLRGAYLDAVSTITSPFEQRQTLAALTRQ